MLFQPLVWTVELIYKHPLAFNATFRYDDYDVAVGRQHGADIFVMLTFCFLRRIEPPLQCVRSS